MPSAHTFCGTPYALFIRDNLPLGCSPQAAENLKRQTDKKTNCSLNHGILFSNSMVADFACLNNYSEKKKKKEKLARSRYPTHVLSQSGDLQRYGRRSTNSCNLYRNFGRVERHDSEKMDSVMSAHTSDDLIYRLSCTTVNYTPPHSTSQVVGSAAEGTYTGNIFAQRITVQGVTVSLMAG